MLTGDPVEAVGEMIILAQEFSGSAGVDGEKAGDLDADFGRHLSGDGEADAGQAEGGAAERVAVVPVPGGDEAVEQMRRKVVTVSDRGALVPEIETASGLHQVLGAGHR